MTFLVDSHCHLASLTYEGKGADNIHEVVKRASLCGVTHFLSIACTNADFKANEEIASLYDNIYLSCGIHPLNLDEDPNWSEQELISNLKSSDKVLALGETGLDYHYAKETRDIQIPSFVKQIQIAHEVKKPLIIHAREAHKDTIDIMTAENARDVGGVIHCFTDSVQMARQCLDLGFYISFTGITTFKPSDNVREVARYVPLDRMMVETDSPYLAPVPVRGVENEPAYVRYTLKYLADFKGVSEDTLARVTSENFEKLYGVKLKETALPDTPCSDYKISAIMNRPFEN